MSKDCVGSNQGGDKVMHGLQVKACYWQHMMIQVMSRASRSVSAVARDKMTGIGSKA